MVLSTIDIIVRRGLLEKGLPIHYYFEYLIHASSCIRELNFDTLKTINTRRLPVNDYGAVDLPDDFVDDVAVCFDSTGTLVKLPHQESIMPLRVHNATTGEFEMPVRYSNNGGVDYGSTYFGSAGWMWFWNVNDYGEPTGRFFGMGSGTAKGYKVIKERRQIQLTGGFEGGAIILQYISDGQSLDSASQIDTRAIQCIRAWQEWKRGVNAENPLSPEATYYMKQKKLLRSRMSNLTLVDIKNTIRNNYKAVIKN